MSENKKVEFKIEDGKALIGVDLNQDGEKFVEATVNFTESIQEMFARGEAIEGAKIVEFGFEGSTLVLKIDTDKDGEEALSLRINLLEGIQEISDLAK